jgi:hypothetical protein
MMGHRKLLFLVAVLWSARALAADPKWEYGKQEAINKPVWKALVNAGLVLNTGNANTLAFSAGGSASFMDGWNKVQLDVGGTYARATLLTATPHDANMGAVGTTPMLVIGPSDLKRTPSTTAALWQLKLRYDRFLTKNNSLYAAGVVTGNTPAGINVAGGAQAGYSRQVLKTEMHLVLAEIGYDYTFQNNVTGPNLNIHSGRLFAGYTLTLTKDIGLSAGIEVLCNLNSLPGFVPGTTVGPFGDTRVNGNAALTSRLYKNIAFQVSFLARYTTDPAPLPPFMAAPFQTGFVPRAETLDTVTSLSLVVTLL